MLILRWCFHLAARRYYGTMVRNNCPHPEVLQAYIRHIGAVRAVERRLGWVA